MRKVAVRALRKPRRGRAIVVYQWEIDVLRTLPPWMRALFEELIACCTFVTGAGQTTYAALVARLTPLQPRSGPRHYVPDAQAIRRGLVQFAERDLVTRLTAASQAGECLFFEIEPRNVKVRPKLELEGGTRRPPSKRESQQRRGLQ